MEVKHEEAFVTDDSLIENLIAAGWKPPSKSGTVGYQGRKNPLGKDRKPLKCFGCGSEYHMLDSCIDMLDMY